MAAPRRAKAIPAHEFHYAALENVDPACRFAYRMRRGYGVDGGRDGIVIGALLASFSHLRDTSRHHWARRFVAFVRQTRERQGAKPTAGRLVADPSPPDARDAPARLRRCGSRGESGAARTLEGRDQGIDGDSSSFSARQGQARGRRRRRLRRGATRRNACARRRARDRFRGAARRRVPRPARRRDVRTRRERTDARRSRWVRRLLRRDRRRRRRRARLRRDTRRGRADQCRRPTGSCATSSRRPSSTVLRSSSRFPPAALLRCSAACSRRAWKARSPPPTDGSRPSWASPARSSARGCTTARARRRFWERVLEGPIAEMVLANNEAAAEAALASEIEREAAAARSRRAAKSISSAPGRAIRTC